MIEVKINMPSSGGGVGKKVVVPPENPVTLPVVSEYDYMVYLGRGQSLSIGTQNGAYNTKPAQPELDQSKFFMLDGVETIGVQKVVLQSTDINGVVGLSETSSIPAQDAYYSPATGALTSFESVTEEVGKYLWLPSGCGGTSIENLSLGGNTSAVDNEIVQFEYLQNNNITADIKAITFYHGGANFEDSVDEYYNKLVAYKDEQISRVQTYFPLSDPDFLLWQHGGENVVIDVMVAQLKLHKEGLGKCVGATYWLNRMYPNVSEGDVTRVGSGGAERVHLKTKGYRYAGEMVTSDPLYVSGYEWVDNSNLILTCSGNTTEGLTIDTTIPEIPSFAGNGIELVKPNGVRIPASSVTTTGNTLQVSFGNDEFLAGDRLLIGDTPRDISYYGDYTPNQQGATYVGNHLVGTNIRTTASRTSKLGNEDYYDWLCVDRIDTEVNNTTPVEQVLGSNIWAGDSNGNAGLGEIFDFDSTTGMLTITKDGVQTTVPSTRTFGASTNKENLAWAIRAGETYQVDFDVENMNTAGRLQFFVGGGGLTIHSTSLVNGHYTGEITANTDYNYSLALRENTGFATTDFNGVVKNIQLRKKLV